ncbi:MAG: hypothetical protein GX825_05135, partial [Syntrophomonadaceae bacterium]|nr:hypothetical protein [Syntrophomonadaceae bacterium]
MAVDKEAILEHMRQKSYRPLKFKELRETFDIEDEAEFSAILGKMEKEGDIVVNRKHKY